MTLLERIKSDALASRKSGEDKVAKSLLVTLSAEVTKVGKDAGNRETTDEEAVAVIKKFAKNAQQTLEALQGANADDEKCGVVKRELEILSGYLPDSIDEKTIEDAVTEILGGMEGPPYDKSAMGSVMKQLKERFGASFDGKTFSPIVMKKIG